MSNREGSLQELLQSAIQNQTNNLYTAMPCIVVSVRDNLEGMMVDIQPTVNQKLKDGTAKERPPILGVPVSFPVSTRAGFTFPIEVGTPGLAVFSMRNLDAWKSGNGRPSNPLNFAKFDKGDAIFIPGIQPPSVSVNNPSKRLWQHSTSDAVLVNNIGTGQEVEVRLKASGDVVINTNQNVFVNCDNATVTAQSNLDITANNITIDALESFNLTSPVANISIGSTSWSGTISQSGNYSGMGVQTFNGVIFSSHVHGASPPPSNP
jgi:hypothetical protein